MFTSDQTPDIDPKISTALERAVEDLRADFASQLQEAKDEIQELRIQVHSPSAAVEPVRRRYEGLDSSPDDLSALHYAVTQIDSSRTQAEILEAALAGSGRFASRGAVFVGKEDSVQGWGSYGFAPEVQELSQATLDLESFPFFRELHESNGAVLMTAADTSQLCEAVGAEAAKEGILIPIVLSDNIVGALYADRLAESDSFNVLALQLLTHAAAQAIEALPERTRSSTATLYIGSAAEPQQTAETVDAAQESIEIEESSDEAEPGSAPEVDVVGSDEHLLEEVSDSLYVDSTGDALDPDLDDHADEVAKEEEQAEASESAESEESAEPAEDITLEAEAAAVDEVSEIEGADDSLAEEPLPASAEEDADVTPPFESDVSSAVVATEPTTEESSLESRDEADDTDKAASSEKPAADFATETVYSEPSAPGTVEESAEPSEPDDVPDSAEPDEPSDLYVEDYSPAGEPDSQHSADSSEASEEASPSPPADQHSHLQPTGEPSTIFNQTAGIPHIPAPGKTSTPVVAPPSGAEIAPPSDLDGPGWAFTATAPSGSSPEEARREEAKRLARLLITEIKLYNEEEVEEGRQSRDLTRRLGEEIERSRQIYDNRIEESIRSKADYFQEELVNILAGGDADAL